MKKKALQVSVQNILQHEGQKEETNIYPVLLRLPPNSNNTAGCSRIFRFHIHHDFRRFFRLSSRCSTAGLPENELAGNNGSACRIFRVEIPGWEVADMPMDDSTAT